MNTNAQLPDFNNSQIVISPFCMTRGVIEKDGKQYIVELRQGKIDAVIIGPLERDLGFQVAEREIAGLSEHTSLNVATKSMAATIFAMSLEMGEALGRVEELEAELKEIKTKVAAE